MFKVTPASLKTCTDTPNCVLEDRVQYSTVHIPSIFCLKYCILRVLFVLQSSGAQRLFDHPVLCNLCSSKHTGKGNRRFKSPWIGTLWRWVSRSRRIQTNVRPSFSLDPSTPGCKGTRFLRNVEKNEASETASNATDLNPQLYRCENLKSHVNIVCSSGCDD